MQPITNPKPLIIAFIILAIIPLAFKAYNYFNSNWDLYDFSGYNFKIKFYNDPDFKYKNKHTEDGNIDIYDWKSYNKDTSSTYLECRLIISDLPENIIHSDSSEAFIDNQLTYMKNRILNDSTIIELETTTREKNGYMGKRTLARNSSVGTDLIIELYLVKNKIFQLYFKTYSKDKFKIDPNIFFESFELVDVPQGKFKLNIDTNRNQSYKIDFPSKTEVHNEVVDSELGTIFTRKEVCKLESGTERVFGITEESLNFQLDTIDQDWIQEIYQTASDITSVKTNGKLLSQKEIDYKGLKGMEYRISLPNVDYILVKRFFIKNKKAYTLIVMTTPKRYNNKAIMKFFDSFEIIEE